MSKVRRHRRGEGRQSAYRVQGAVLEEQVVHSIGTLAESEGCTKWHGVRRFGASCGLGWCVRTRAE